MQCIISHLHFFLNKISLEQNEKLAKRDDYFSLFKKYQNWDRRFLRLIASLSRFPITEMTSKVSVTHEMLGFTKYWIMQSLVSLIKCEQINFAIENNGTLSYLHVLFQLLVKWNLRKTQFLIKTKCLKMEKHWAFTVWRATNH